MHLVELYHISPINHTNKDDLVFYDIKEHDSKEDVFCLVRRMSSGWMRSIHFRD